MSELSSCTKLASRNAQTIVPGEVHKMLREEAYERKMPLRDLLRVILTDHAKQFAEKRGMSENL